MGAAGRGQRVDHYDYKGLRIRALIPHPDGFEGF
jgi:hypothetical protein